MHVRKTIHVIYPAAEGQIAGLVLSDTKTSSMADDDMYGPAFGLESFVVRFDTTGNIYMDFRLPSQGEFRGYSLIIINIESFPSSLMISFSRRESKKVLTVYGRGYRSVG